jgi:glycerol uptake facilitator protein
LTIDTPTAVLAEAFATFILAIVVVAAVDTRNSFAPNLPLFALWIGFIGWGAAAFPGVGRPRSVSTVGPILGALVGGAVWSFVFGRS